MNLLLAVLEPIAIKRVSAKSVRKMSKVRILVHFQLSIQFCVYELVERKEGYRGMLMARCIPELYDAVKGVRLGSSLLRISPMHAIGLMVAAYARKAAVRLIQRVCSTGVIDGDSKRKEMTIECTAMTTKRNTNGEGIARVIAPMACRDALIVSATIREALDSKLSRN